MGFETVRMRIAAIVVRVFQATCMGIVAGCVAAANGYCVTSAASTICTYADMAGLSIEYWSEHNFKELKGQFFVFVSALVFLIVSFGLIFMAFADRKGRNVVAVLCSSGAMIMLIAGILEAWYASGFGNGGNGITFYVRSWVAGSIFCFLGMILYVIDVLMTLKKNSVSDDS